MTGAKPNYPALDALMGVFGFRRADPTQRTETPASEDACPVYDDAKERAWFEKCGLMPKQPTERETVK